MDFFDLVQLLPTDDILNTNFLDSNNRNCIYYFLIRNKVGCDFSMVISAEFRMLLYRDDDHWEDAPHFIY